MSEGMDGGPGHAVVYLRAVEKVYLFLPSTY